ncbi:MAG TPA: hypothetical protein PKI27_03530 [Dermatophilaceae bacterium]|nr:hypothetical protein [Dermatophilaceae bacterium]
MASYTSTTNVQVTETAADAKAVDVQVTADPIGDLRTQLQAVVVESAVEPVIQAYLGACDLLVEKPNNVCRQALRRGQGLLLQALGCDAATLKAVMASKRPPRERKPRAKKAGKNAAEATDAAPNDATVTAADTAGAEAPKATKKGKGSK